MKNHKAKALGNVNKTNRKTCKLHAEQLGLSDIIIMVINKK